MKYILISILILLVTISTISASLTITPNPQNLTLKQNVESTIEATFNNNYNFKILDFKFTNTSGFTFPTSISLNANESKTISYKVKPTQAGSYLANTKVSFKYMVDLPDDQTTRYVNISQYGFIPERLIIREGDTVIWRNNDQITRTVTSGKFDQELSQNETFSWQFTSEEGTFHYQDLVLFYGADIVIINASEEEKVNNPVYDITWNFKLDVALDPTSLLINTTKTNFSVGATDTKEGILSITNIGSIIAQKVKLTADPDWITFDENEFGLAPDEVNYVTYHIAPKIFETASTNRTYTVAVRIKGTNTNQSTVTLKVFVPYSNVFDDIETNEGFLDFYSRFCSENPNLFICNPNAKPLECNDTITIRDPTIPVNLSTREVLALLKRIQSIEDSNARTDNELKALSVKYKADLPKILDLLNQSVSMQAENERVMTSRYRAFWWTGFFLLIIVLIIVIALLVRRHISRKDIVDSGYNYRQ